jgi:hypothetical protein
MIDKEYITFNELIEKLGVSANDVHYLIQQKKLKPSIVWHGFYYQVSLLDTSFNNDLSSFVEFEEKDADDNYVYHDADGSEIFSLANPKSNGAYKYTFKYAICPNTPEENVFFRFCITYGNGETFDESYIEKNAFFMMVDVVRYQAHEIEKQSQLNMTPKYKHYTSDMLSYLNQASDKFWANALPNETDTHPKNSDVEKWLIERGYSETLAKKAASIIRPDWASKGRPKEI